MTKYSQKNKKTILNEIAEKENQRKIHDWIETIGGINGGIEEHKRLTKQYYLSEKLKFERNANNKRENYDE